MPDHHHGPEHSAERQGQTAANTRTADKGEIHHHSEQAQQPSFPGPGENATAKDPIEPHSSKVLNKLDPRFDSDILEKTKKDEEQAEREKGDFDRIMKGEKTG